MNGLIVLCILYNLAHVIFYGFKSIKLLMIKYYNLLRHKYWPKEKAKDPELELLKTIISGGAPMH
jgi:hypothetical protein